MKKSTDSRTAEEKKELSNALYRVLEPRDAEDLINGIIESEINFLKLKNLKSEVIHFAPDADCRSQIEKLQGMKSEMQLQLQYAKALGARVRVSTAIEIESAYEAG